MKKICILISVLFSIVGGVAFNSLNKQETPKLEQVNVSEKVAEEKVDKDLQKEIKDNSDSDEIQEKVDREDKKQDEVKSDSTPQQKDISSASKSVSKTKEKQENQSNSSVSSEVKEQKKEPQNEQPAGQNSNSKNTQTQQSGVTTKFYESITGGKKEFSSESEAFARGLEIQNRELDYVLDYNEQHPEAPIQPDINYFRVYPSFIDENGHYWYYLHFFCQSGEGNDEYLKNKF